MPNCTATQVPFAKLGRRAIDVRFDGGDVSSDGGLLLLREVERRLGLLKAVAKVLPDPRDPALFSTRLNNCCASACSVSAKATKT